MNKEICNRCKKEKEGVQTGLCNHCGRFGKTDKELAIEWWNGLSNDNKKIFSDRWELFTTHEIHLIWATI